MAVSIDQLVSTGQIPIPQHIKIDVDGYEHLVVDGRRGVIESGSLKSILIEIDRDPITSPLLSIWEHSDSPILLIRWRRRELCQYQATPQRGTIFFTRTLNTVFCSGSRAAATDKLQSPLNV